MRFFSARLALVCALLLISSSAFLLGVNCSLASYSETRSFRDALDGRSMEDAISGPVDTDTSSYGDRTSSSPAYPTSSSSASSSPSSPAASSMMLTIPANGNLNNMIPQQMDDEQQQRQSGSELEREAGPVPANDQQQLMEQKSARQRTNGRLKASPAPSAGMRNARQQQPLGDSTSGSTKTGNAESGFGDDLPASVKSARPASMARQDNNERPMMSYNSNRLPNEQSQRQTKGGPDVAGQEDQQQQDVDQRAMNNEPDQQQQQDKSYATGGPDDQQMAARQRAMAAMLMSMNSGMKYSRNGSPMAPANQPMADKRATSSMAKNMMASLASKAAYMGMQKQQQQQQQRSIPPPVMVSMITTGSPKKQLGARAGSYPGALMNNMSPAAAGAGGSMAGYAPRGGMRRANQRKVERKMSPAMVNAMLNKMLSMKQKEQETGSPMVAANGANYMMKAAMSPAMEMLMKSPAGAEMLANMVMPQMGGAVADMPPAKKEQYKRMMMEAIMQQADDSQQQQAEKSYQDSSSQMSDAMEAMMRPASGASRGPKSRYNSAPMSGMTSSTMSPIALMMSMMNGGGQMKQNGGYDADQQRAPMTPAGQYMATRMAKKGGSASRQMGAPSMMSANEGGFDQAQQQEQQPEQQAMDGGAAGGYPNKSDQQQRELPAANQQVAPNMGSVKGSAAATVAAAMGRSQAAGRAMPMAGGNYGRARSGMMMPTAMNGVTKPAMGGKQQYSAPDTNSQTMNARQMNGNGFEGNDGDEQQREMSPMGPTAASDNMMNPQTKPDDYSGEASGPMSPMAGNRRPAMNGFRQAYDQQQSQQPMMDESAGSNPSAMGTKSPSNSYKQTSMPRPMPMQQSYGQQANSDQPMQQQQDEYGAAPMGMAEPFAFDYKIEDDYGNGQYRKEESDKNGAVKGSYGYTDMSGIYRHVEYVADENGFRANIKSNEPGLSSESATTNNNDNNGGNSASNNNRSSGNGETDSQPPMAAADNMNSNSPMDSANGNPQQQLQQQLMMMMAQQTSQSELNENGEK